MKKKILFAFAILAVLSMAIAAFAYGGIAVTNVGDKASCCKKDSCPMKVKGHEGHDANGEHAKMDCCKKHDGDHAKAEGKTCDCCGDSCPMKKSDGASATDASAEGKSCCDCCGDSCPMKKGEKDTSV